MLHPQIVADNILEIRTDDTDKYFVLFMAKTFCGRIFPIACTEFRIFVTGSFYCQKFKLAEKRLEK